MSKPKTYILAVTKKNTQCIIPKTKQKKIYEYQFNNMFPIVQGWVSTKHIKTSTNIKVIGKYYDLLYSQSGKRQILYSSL